MAVADRDYMKNRNTQNRPKIDGISLADRAVKTKRPVNVFKLFLIVAILAGSTLFYIKQEAKTTPKGIQETSKKEAKRPKIEIEVRDR